MFIKNIFLDLNIKEKNENINFNIMYEYYLKNSQELKEKLKKMIQNTEETLYKMEFHAFKNNNNSNSIYLF